MSRRPPPLDLQGLSHIEGESDMDFMKRLRAYKRRQARLFKNSMWGLFAADRTKNFPNFFPVGFFETREEALALYAQLPPGPAYQLFHFPVGCFFARITPEDQLESQLGILPHEHLGEGPES